MAETKVFKLDPASPDMQSIREAADVLKNGGLVAFPTETVYGIGASLEKKESIEKLYGIKSRPKDKPFTVHIASPDAITKMGCEVSYLAQALIDKFWPGPLTIILQGRDKKIGFRMPSNKIALALITESAVPLAVPSANLSGRPPAITAGEVISEFSGKVDIIIDGGKTGASAESTVIDATAFPFKVLREGAISKSRISEAWKLVWKEQGKA